MSNPREILGLDAAEKGDVAAAEKFLSFAHRELHALAILSELPQPIKNELAMLARQIDGAQRFISGFQARVATQETRP